MSFRAVIFDLDGTLLDTLEDIADSANAVLEHRGFPHHDLQEYRYLVGEGIEALVRKALPKEVITDAQVSSFVADLKKEYAARWRVKTRPYPGIAELLDGLAARGIALAVLSNKPDDFTRTMVADLLPSWHFQIVQGATATMPKKPDPVAALQIGRRLSLHEGEILFVGDSGIDMQTALRAGMHPAGALWGFRTAEELTASGARVLLREPAELLELIDKNVDCSPLSVHRRD